MCSRALALRHVLLHNWRQKESIGTVRAHPPLHLRQLQCCVPSCMQRQRSAVANTRTDCFLRCLLALALHSEKDESRCNCAIRHRSPWRLNRSTALVLRREPQSDDITASGTEARRPREQDVYPASGRPVLAQPFSALFQPDDRDDCACRNRSG